MTARPEAGPRPAGLVYLLHFDVLYMPYPGAPAYKCAGHYTWYAAVREHCTDGWPSTGPSKVPG